jgi:hypothetical protein
MKTVIDALTMVAGAALLGASGLWLISALVVFDWTVGDRMDDNGCSAGHPGWAVAQLGVTVVGAAASVICASFRAGDRKAVPASWAFAGASLMFCIWLVLMYSVPHARLIGPTC